MTNPATNCVSLLCLVEVITPNLSTTECPQLQGARLPGGVALAVAHANARGSDIYTSASDVNESKTSTKDKSNSNKDKSAGTTSLGVFRFNRDLRQVRAQLTGGATRLRRRTTSIPRSCT